MRTLCVPEDVSLCASGEYGAVDPLFGLGDKGKQNLQGMSVRPADGVSLAHVQGFCCAEGVLEVCPEQQCGERSSQGWVREAWVLPAPP